jgi:hypothetical protein
MTLDLQGPGILNLYFERIVQQSYRLNGQELLHMYVNQCALYTYKKCVNERLILAGEGERF